MTARWPCALRALAAALAMLAVVPGLLPLAAVSGEECRAAVSWAASSTGLPGASNYYGICLADVNKDSRLDIVAAGESAGLRVFLGDGTGSWTAVATHPSTSGGYNDVRAGDVDNDGNPDIVAGTTGMKLYKGNGVGGFTDSTSGSGLPTSDQWRGIALGDVNKDGYLDIAATSGYGSSRGIRVLVGNGTGKFVDNSTGLSNSQDRDSSIVLVDFNGDGNLDLAAGGSAGVDCYLGNGGAGGAMSWTISSTGLPDNRFSGVNACDFNNDGMKDIILGAYNAGGGVGLRAYRNVNNAASWVSSSTGLNSSGDFIDVSAADFDGDGNMDILTAGSYDDTAGIHVFYGDGSGGWTLNFTDLPRNNRYIGSDVGDFNGDGSVDFAIGSYSSRGVLAYRNQNYVAPVPQPLLSLGGPLGGAVWSGGIHQQVSWTATNGTAPYNLTLSYSTDGGLSYPNLITPTFQQSDNGSGNYDWELPRINSSSVRVRVGLSDARDKTASNSSPANFAIDSAPPQVLLVVPLDGAQGVSNSTSVRLRFSEGMNQSSAVGAVSVSGPGSPALLAPTWLVNDLSFQTSGLLMGQRYNVTVSTAAQDDSVPGNPLPEERTFSFNTSEAPIPAISLNQPAGGEVWTSGSSQDILWDASGGTGTLTISLDYSVTGPGGSWLPITSNESNDGLYDWVVPNTPSADCYVRATVTDSFSPPKNGSGMCGLPFTIMEAKVPLTVNLTSPSGGESWRGGTRQNITWNTTGGNGARSILLVYSIQGAGGPWTYIASNESDDGLHEWLVPDLSSVQTYVRVTVTDSYSPPQSASDTSDAPFELRGIPRPLSVRLTAPNGGENWTVGTRHNISWTLSGGVAPHRVSLDYSTTGASGNWDPIAASISGTGPFLWLVPNASSADCYVRITAADSDAIPANASDLSNGSFIIRPPFVDDRPPEVHINNPAAGRTFKGTVTIDLSATDNVGVTRMELLIDGVSFASFNAVTGRVDWDASKVAKGPHNLTARAWDARGNMGTTTISITISKPAPPAEPGFLEKNWLLLTAVVVLVVAALLVVMLLSRRRPPPAEATPAAAHPAAEASQMQPLYPLPPPGWQPPPPGQSGQ